MTTALAIYAAIVGTIGVGWQIWREKQRLRTNLRVEIEHCASAQQGLIGTTSDGPRPLDYEVVVNVINDGETTEYVRRVSIEDAQESHGIDLHLRSDPDAELPPRGRTKCSIRLDTAVGAGWAEGFKGIAWLASGRSVESVVEIFDQDIIEHIEVHNQPER